MADFVAVLKKTIASLGESTPESRQKVYDKARATIDAKLSAIKPPPPASVIERQKKALEDAIAAVEVEYTPPPVEEDDLEALFASMDLETAASQPVEADGVTPVRSAPAGLSAGKDAPVAAGALPSFTPETERDERPLFVDEPTPRRRGRAALMVAAGVVVGLVAGGYALWLNNDAFRAMLGGSPSSQAASEAAAAPEVAAAGGDEEGTDAGEDEGPVYDVEPPAPEDGQPDRDGQPAEGEPQADVAAAEPAEPQGEEPSAETPQKFTQRLTPDGQEVDVGPADGAAGLGEGTSVATAIIPETPAAPATEPPPDEARAPPAETPAADAAAAMAEPAPTPTPADPATPPATAPQTAEAAPAATTPAPSQPAIAVGQRAIFYEERTSAAQGSAESGSIVWSIVQESPGGDLPPEPAIRAEATIPGKDLQLRMTIRRNRDQTLPASHIVELIFLTPENFEGGGIENVLRMTMKTSEEAAGNPLLGIPAKIADGFFLLALTDGEPEIAQNLALMQRDQWIDVPMVYRSGRRALITMEKGVPGARVFEEAVKAWQSASSG